MLQRLITISLIALVVTATGCAGYRLTPISPKVAKASHEQDKGMEGYVFYAPQPYLLGTLKSKRADGEVGGYDFKIIYLPDKRKPYRFTRYEFLAKSDLKINFEDGWKFTGADSSTDTTAAVEGLLDLAAGAVGLLNTGGTGAAPATVLFRINLDDPNSPKLEPVQFTS